MWRARRDMAGHGGPSGESVLRCPPSVLGGIRDPEPVAVNDTALPLVHWPLRSRSQHPCLLVALVSLSRTSTSSSPVLLPDEVFDVHPPICHWRLPVRLVPSVGPFRVLGWPKAKNLAMQISVLGFRPGSVRMGLCGCPQEHPLRPQGDVRDN